MSLSESAALENQENVPLHHITGFFSLQVANKRRSYVLTAQEEEGNWPLSFPVALSDRPTSLNKCHRCVTEVGST